MAPARLAKLNAYIDMLERPERDDFQQPDAVLETLSVRPGERVADVGAGSGYFTLRLAEAVGPTGSVWAVDIEPLMLEHIGARAAAQGMANVRLRLASPDDPRLPSAQFSTVLMVDVWHYLQNRSAYAARLRKALAPGGRVVVIDYIPKPYEVRPWGPLPEQQLSPATVDADMRAAGLLPRVKHTFLTEQYFVEYALG